MRSLQQDLRKEPLRMRTRKVVEVCGDVCSTSWEKGSNPGQIGTPMSARFENYDTVLYGRIISIMFNIDLYCITLLILYNYTYN